MELVDWSGTSLNRIITEIEVGAHGLNACKRLAIAVERPNDTKAFLGSLHEEWWRDMSGGLYSQEQLALLFDNFLHRIRGFGPRRVQEEKGREFAHLIGYSRDPACMFLELRNLLPPHPCATHTDGTVEVDGLHYWDKLLTYFPRRAVIFRQSAHAEARAWIYLNGEILCEAMATELRRQDGTHRPNR